jgi:RNA polymerase sigma-70 factor (ECF subfamily)
MTGAAEQEDAALVEEALAGQERSFSTLMRRHKQDLYRFIRLYVGDSGEAYDLLQEAFVAAWRNLGQYDGARSFRAWLRGIALNKCRDWSRRRKVRQFFYFASDIETTGRHVPAPELSIESGEHDEQLGHLETAIAALPDGLKAPLLLTAIEGHSHKEAGAILGMSAKAIEVRVYRAKQTLRQAMALPDDEDVA